MDISGLNAAGEVVGLQMTGSANGRGPAHVIDGQIGIARARFVNVLTNTAPIAATSGVALFKNPVVGVVIESVRVVSMTSIPLTQGADFSIRYAIDAPNDSGALLMIPLAVPTGSATTEAGQVGSFNVTPVIVPDTEAAGDLRVFNLILPRPIEINLSSGISRLDFVHQIGTAVLLQFGIRAVEVV